MRHLASFIMTSLDGFHEGPGHSLDWHHVDAEFNRFANDQLDRADTLIFGRRTYELMASYWSTPDALRDDPEVASRMNDMPKLVLSRNLPAADWAGTTILRGTDELAALRARDGRDMLVLGSARLTASLAGSGLLDELRIMINPVALGRGTSVLDGLDGSLELRLLTTRTFESGNVLLTYEPAPAGAQRG